MRIPSAEHREFRVAMGVQGTAIVAKVCVDDSKVEVYDEILIAIGRRVLTDIEVAIEPLKLVCRVDVVIVSQHRQGQTLAEASWANEEEKLVCSLHFLYKPRLVYIVAVVLADSHEVHHSVRYSLCHCLLFIVVWLFCWL